ncbi:hypothetical protein ACIPSA_24545 [Streptomyces sp. NPDC086549]|uniref:hypothetical protein n=1 Tax=Streptomyces sp. NPDC086549 TaxID=3365752 RepID=UPI00382C2BD4
MTEHTQPARRVRNTIARVAALAGVAVAAVALATPSAMAGTSAKLNGCYSTWGSTGSVGHCARVTTTGNFKNRGVCTFGNEDSLWEFFGAGESHPKWGGVECTFDIEKSFIMFSN